MQHSVPADTVPVSPTPWRKSQQGGRQGPRSWRCPEWVRTVPGASSCAGGGGREGPGEPRHPSPAQSSPFLLSCSCPRGHSSPWPQGGLLGLGFPAKTGNKLPAQGCVGALCVLHGRMDPKGLEVLPKKLQELELCNPAPLLLEGTSSSSAWPGAAVHRDLGLQGWTNLPGMLLPTGLTPCPRKPGNGTAWNSPECQHPVAKLGTSPSFSL